MASVAMGDQPEEQQGLLGTLGDAENDSGRARSGGWGSRLAISCRRLLNRTTFAVASSVGLLISPIGGVCILGAGSIITSVIMGPAKSVQVALSSAGIVSSLQFVYTFFTCPSRDVSGIEVLAQLSQGDDTMWKAAKELMGTFDKLLKAFPDLNRPRIAALRDGAPDELLMRFITIISRHQSQINPKDAPSGTWDDSSEAGTGTTSNGQRPGPVASEEKIQELRYWIHFAEAAYYEMKTEDQLKQWLSAEGCDLLYASSENSPNAPVYFVAIQPERKELIVSLRGTMSVSDAVTDMIVTPQQWGDTKEYTVHSGIGKSADKVYQRLKHLVPAFAANAFTVVLVGHSLGAGVAALLAWRLREQDGVDGVKVFSFATPPCASPVIASDCREYVVSCVFRDDVVPRLAPKAIVELEKELLELEWEEMESCAESWGPLGKIVLKRAKEAAQTNKDEVDKLETEHKDDPLGHKQKAVRDGEEGEGEAGEGEEDGDDGNGCGDSDTNSDLLMDPTVPGQIVYLHAMSESAKRCKAAEVRENEGKGEAVPSDQREADFECVEIESQDPCLSVFRLSNQSVDDHFLEQYRMGLRMRPRVVGGQQEDPAEA